MQDANLLLSGSISATTNAITAQTATGTDTSVLGDKSVDLATATDIGEGEQLYLRTVVATAASGGTSVEFQFVGADDAALTSNLLVLGSSGAIAVASLTAGAKFETPLPPRISSLGKRYVGIRYVTVGAVAAGAYVSDITNEVGDPKKFYGSGFSVK